MTTGRRHGLLAAGAVVLAVFVAVTFLSGMSEQRRLDRARRVAVSQRRNLHATRASNTEQTQALGDAHVLGATLAKELIGAKADVGFTQSDLAEAVKALETARGLMDEQSSRRATIGQCLIGVRRALDATARGNTAGAAAFLRVAAPTCLAAMNPTGEGDPVLAFDFADPYVMRAGGDYYAFATNAAGGSVQAARSGDLVHWELLGNALQNIPSWAVPGSVWAPAAVVRSGVTILYFTVREGATGRQCLSFALGVLPGGPFLDGSSKPLECAEHGAIDPSPFVDGDGTLYLLYKTERPPRLWSRPLTADGRTFAGPAQLLLTPTQGWHAGNVEAPSMVRNGSSYWLFYSGNDWNGPSYAEGVARCAGPVGPCMASGPGPVLASHGIIAGPGGGEVFSDRSGGWWLAYHAYQRPLVGYPNSRLLYFARIGFPGGGGTPTVSP